MSKDFEFERTDIESIEMDDVEESIDRRIKSQLQTGYELDKKIDFIGKAIHIHRWIGAMPLGNDKTKSRMKKRSELKNNDWNCLWVAALLIVGGITVAWLASNKSDTLNQWVLYGYAGLGLFLGLCGMLCALCGDRKISALLYIDVDCDAWDENDDECDAFFEVYILHHGKTVLAATTSRIGGKLVKSGREIELFIDGDWVKNLLEIYPQSLEEERKAKYEERIDELRQRLDGAMEKADKWGFLDKLDMSEVEIRAKLDARLDELVLLSNEITANDRNKMKTFEMFADETFKQIEELGFVTVINNVCAYCMAYIGKVDKCNQCGATRRTKTLS